MSDPNEPLTFQRFRKVNVQRCLAAFRATVNDWTPTDWATALAGEVGEACNIIKKMRRLAPTPEQMSATGYTGDYDALRAMLADELGDIQTYLDLLAARFDIDLEAATVRKFNAVSARRNCDVRL